MNQVWFVGGPLEESGPTMYDDEEVSERYFEVVLPHDGVPVEDQTIVRYVEHSRDGDKVVFKMDGVESA